MFFPGVSCGRGIEAASFTVISSAFVAAAVGGPPLWGVLGGAACGGSWGGGSRHGDPPGSQRGTCMLLMRRAGFCQEGRPGSSLGGACPPLSFGAGSGPECAGGGWVCVGSGHTVWSLT